MGETGKNRGGDERERKLKQTKNWEWNMRQPKIIWKEEPNQVNEVEKFDKVDAVDEVDKFN